MGLLTWCPLGNTHCLRVLVYLAVVTAVLAMKEEHLDPARDSTVSVHEDLRRSPRPYMDTETGLLTYERDYLRRNHETSEYTRLLYRSTRRSGSYVDLENIFNGAPVRCDPVYVEIVCASSDVIPQMRNGTLLYASTCLPASTEENMSKSDPNEGLDPVDIEHHATFRNVTGNVTVMQGEDGCINIRIPSLPTSAFSFFGTTTFHFFTNHSDPDGKKRRALDTDTQKIEASLLSSLSGNGHSRAEEQRSRSSGPRRSWADDFSIGFADAFPSLSCSFGPYSFDVCDELPSDCGFDKVTIPVIDEDIGPFNPCGVFPTSCGFDIPQFNPCGDVTDGIRSALRSIEDVIIDLVQTIASAITSAIDALKTAINNAFEEAGLSPIWDGIFTQGIELSLFSFNYNYYYEKADRGNISLVGRPARISFGYPPAVQLTGSMPTCRSTRLPNCRSIA